VQNDFCNTIRGQADPGRTVALELMITILGGLAEFERSLILARTSEGCIRPMARGVRLGRKLKSTKHQIAEALARREAGEALVEIGRS
jgi:DNA invertase Pin-like site-specific DNA recombinase